ncbi:MAG: menaquinone biosynthesis decarboxylase [Bacteroidales bacterium]|nr:menaquinone biosynthesis decarboxylase [Bacteroidales bacterium]
MAFYSLAKWVSLLREKGEVCEINEYVSPELEISEFADRITNSNNSKPLLFKNNGTDFPVLVNLFANSDLTNRFLNLENEKGAINRIEKILSLLKSKPRFSIDFFSSLWEMRNLSPKKLRKSGTCMENEMDFPDISKFPVIKSWPFDGGRFLTLPLVHTIDPETGIQNMGMYRMQVFDGKSTGMHWHKHKGGAAHFEKWKKLGKQMPVTVTLGGDPTFIYAATAPVPDGFSEYMLAGFLKNEKVKLVKSKTNDIWIPECSDFVIEGYIDTSEPFRTEGPFGDHTGFYSIPDEYPVFHITKISFRKNAVYPATVVGVPKKEDRFFGMATTKIFLPLIKNILIPEITDMFLPEEGGFHNLALVKTQKKYRGQAEKIFHAMWGAGQMMFMKNIFVFDENVDLRNLASVLSAIDNNFDPSSGLIFSKGPSDVLDHAAKEFSFGGKAGFDCTAKEKTLKENNISSFFKGCENIKKISNSIFVLFTNSPVEDSNSIIQGFKNEKSINNRGILIITDLNTQGFSNSKILWYILANIDPNRDYSIICNGQSNSLLLINASVKDKKAVPHGNWPAITIMSDEIIKKVDLMWNRCDTGEFVESPSKEFSMFKSNSHYM